MLENRSVSPSLNSPSTLGWLPSSPIPLFVHIPYQVTDNFSLDYGSFILLFILSSSSGVWALRKQLVLLFKSGQRLFLIENGHKRCLKILMIVAGQSIQVTTRCFSQLISLAYTCELEDSQLSQMV